MPSFNVGIDVMGADKAPSELVGGVVEAAKIASDSQFTIIGRKEELGDWNFPQNVKIEDAHDIIESDEQPVNALRKKRNSSVMKGVKLVLAKELNAFVSAGNTGALVAASIFKLGLIEGVKKCGILVPTPTDNGMSAIIDAGANPVAKPLHYLHNAVMGQCYLKIVDPEHEPTTGLLNIGEESIKGTEIIQQAYKLCKNFLHGFVGNIEGHDILKGKAKLILCDGFVGNIILKFGESMSEFIIGSLLKFEGTTKDAKSKLLDIAKLFDFAEYGGAPILGVNGTVMICHGRSDQRAIKNAVLNSLNLVQHGINERIAKEINEHSLWKRFQKIFKQTDES